MDPDKYTGDIAVAGQSTSLLDDHVFVPIALNWRKKYYRTSLTRRAIALLLDCIVTIIPLLLVLAVVFLIIGLDVDKDDPYGLYTSICFFFMVIFYSAIMESSRYRGTFGKVWMKIQITDKDGFQISFLKAIWRNTLKITVLYSYFLVIPFVIQIFRFIKTKKIFHDELSSTLIGDVITNTNPGVFGNVSEPKIPLNKKFIFQLSSLGLVLGIVDVFNSFITVTYIFSLILYIIYAYLIAKKCVGRYALHAFWVGFLSVMCEIIMQLIFFETYVSNSTAIQDLLIKVESSPRLALLLNSVIYGIIAGLMLVFFTFIASAILKKNRSADDGTK